MNDCLHKDKVYSDKYDAYFCMDCAEWTQGMCDECFSCPSLSDEALQVCIIVEIARRQKKDEGKVGRNIRLAKEARERGESPWDKK